MISIQIPKEISSYETKLIGPFTTRQTICVVCMSVIDIIIYNIIGGFVSLDLAIFACILGALPFGLLGWYKPYGMTFEKYFKTVLINLLLAPTKRVYKTENSFTVYRKALVDYEKNRKSGKIRKKKRPTQNNSIPSNKKVPVNKQVTNKGSSGKPAASANRRK